MGFRRGFGFSVFRVLARLDLGFPVQGPTLNPIPGTPQVSLNFGVLEFPNQVALL